MKNVRFTPHAEANLVERLIDRQWVFDTIRHPERLEKDAAGPQRMSAFRQIAAFGNRWLHVAFDEEGTELTVVIVFLDRRAGSRQ